MDKEKVKRYKIYQSKEQDFDPSTCFQNVSLQGYVKDSDYYYDSYSHFSIHEEMLKDNIRTKAYQTAILRNKHQFKDKIVLDVGAGTGILSMFAAQAGAKHVYAVENANIIDFSKKIIEENNLSGKITLIKGKLEEIILPVEKVDIIISEWMGYFLLYESMLDCVLYARDKYLAPDGLMFPDHAIIYLATFEDEEYRNQKLGFWENVYGIDMSCIKNQVLKEPIVDVVEKEVINSTSYKVLDINLLTVKLEDLNFESKFEFIISRDDYVHGIIGWFDVYFDKLHIPIQLSTSPFSSSTHWKQTVFYLQESLIVCKNDIIIGHLKVCKSKQNPRDLDIEIRTQLKNRFIDVDWKQSFILN